VLSRRAFLVLVIGGACAVAVGDAVTAGREMAQAVFTGVRAALRGSLVRVLEPQKGSWVNNNLWGEQRFEPLPSTPGSVVSVLPKNTKLFGPPAVHSIQLGRSDAVDAQNADVYARITLGCGGIENQFDVDWLHGIQFAAVCNSLSVQAVTYAPDSTGAYHSAGAAVALKVMVAKGSTNPSRCPATYTQALVNLKDVLQTPLNFVIYTVPDFARELTVHVLGNNNPATPTAITISFQNQGGSVIAQYNAQVCAGGRSIPIPGGANTVFIENASSDDETVSAQWFLGL
jgi:hypothetical protein